MVQHFLPVELYYDMLQHLKVHSLQPDIFWPWMGEGEEEKASL